MARTVANYLASMKQAIGNANPSTGTVLLDLLNDALQELFLWHPWNWRLSDPTLLNLVAGRDYVTLPADFGQGQIISVSSVFSPYTMVHISDLTEIAELRGSVTQSTLDFWVAPIWPTQTSTVYAPGQARLAIWPTPATSKTGAMRIVYRRGPATLSLDAQIPNIPPAYEAALLHLARSNAAAAELDADNPVAANERALAVTILDRLIQMDGSANSNLGPITGGAVLQVSDENDSHFEEVPTTRRSYYTA